MVSWATSQVRPVLRSSANAPWLGLRPPCVVGTTTRKPHDARWLLVLVYSEVAWKKPWPKAIAGNRPVATGWFAPAAVAG